MDISIIFCYLIGAVFAYFGIVSLVKTLHDQRVCKREIDAQIVDYEVQKSSGEKGGMPHDHYYPVYSFYAEGKTVRKTGNVGYHSRVYPVGSEMKVLYEAGNPENFIVPGKNGMSYGVSVIISLMGLGLIAVTVLRNLGIVTF